MRKLFHYGNIIPALMLPSKNLVLHVFMPRKLYDGAIIAAIIFMESPWRETKSILPLRRHRKGRGEKIPNTRILGFEKL